MTAFRAAAARGFRLVPAGLQVAGLALAAIGVGLIFVPAGIILAGVGVFAVGLMAGYTPRLR